MLSAVTSFVEVKVLDLDKMWYFPKSKMKCRAWNVLHQSFPDAFHPERTVSKEEEIEYIGQKASSWSSSRKDGDKNKKTS